jgi:prevent-host-death family protein
MNWNIAQAKQRFSDVIKKAAEEPQVIFNRDRPVAAVIGVEEFAAFEKWRKIQANPRTLADEFAELRQLMRAEGYEDGFELPPRQDRPNAFVEMLEEAYAELSMTALIKLP